jgi:hypothetical protein
MQGRIVCFLFCLLLGYWNQGVAATDSEGSETLPSWIDPAVLDVIFSGSETMHYAVSWGGGVKIGDIYMKIQKEKTKDDAFTITARVKDYGPLKLLYPVDDRFTCFVSGPMKLPYRYEVHQKEGFGRETTRLTQYDQANRIVRYQRNKESEQQFEIAGTVYNEFASFVVTRALTLKEGEPTVIPTFADKKLHEVQVSLVQREQRRTLFGDTATLKVQPKMQFKGLYEKSGATVLWLTDDRCRVPVEIHSKIVIGSLVAELVDYTNSACPELLKMKER